ncbi:MAG TPA: hypothetical protein VEX68_26315 [Bryobacteraceae bacterium]|nr:hypothetical protein [Bryobacteraceae bacterium]
MQTLEIPREVTARTAVGLMYTINLIGPALVEVRRHTRSAMVDVSCVDHIIY